MADVEALSRNAGLMTEQFSRALAAYAKPLEEGKPNTALADSVTEVVRTLGSVAEDVMHHAEVPVVTIRAQHRPGCAAQRCATCDLGRTSMEDLVSAEDVG